MCDPVSAGLALFSIATTAFGYVEQNNAAQDQLNAIAAGRNASLRDINARSKELEGSSAEEKSELAIEALRKKGATRVASSENASGLTSQLLLQDVYAQEGREVTGLDVTRQRRQRQLGREAEGIRAGASRDAATVKIPSAAGAGLQIASTGLGAYEKSRKPKTK